MQLKVYNFENQKITAKTLPEGIFGENENAKLLAEAVRVYLSNQRKAHAKAKRRGEVVGSNKKIWSQKGTGRARHGDRKAPIFVGGGVAHGPAGLKNWHLSLSTKKKEAALKAALFTKNIEGTLLVIEDFGKVGSKTKEANDLIQKVVLAGGEKKPSKKQPQILLVFEKLGEKILPYRNLAGVRITTGADLHAYTVLNNRYLIIEEKALAILTNRLKAKVETRIETKKAVKKTVKKEEK